MDKKLVVVAIAVAAGLAGSLIPLLTQQPGGARVAKPVIWGLLAAGVVAFLAVLVVRFTWGAA